MTEVLEGYILTKILRVCIVLRQDRAFDSLYILLLRNKRKCILKYNHSQCENVFVDKLL